MLLSGGVDSTVCAALLHRALQPDQVIALHVDNGFMRQDESRKVEESLKALGLHLTGLSALFHIQSLRLTWSKFELVKHCVCVSLVIFVALLFSALTLLVGWQEGQPACKNRVVGC